VSSCDSVSSWAVTIKGYKFVRNDRTVRGRNGTDSSGVGIYIGNGLMYKIVRHSTEIGLEFMFVEIKLLNRVILVGLVFRPPNSSIVYHALKSGDYGLEAFDGVCSDLLSL
jgi:hypothetical protein